METGIWAKVISSQSHGSAGGVGEHRLIHSASLLSNYNEPRSTDHRVMQFPEKCRSFPGSDLIGKTWAFEATQTWMKILAWLNYLLVESEQVTQHL